MFDTILGLVPVTASVVLGGCVLWLLLGVSARILAALGHAASVAAASWPWRCSGLHAGVPHRPGLGAATVQAISYNDLPMMQGVVLCAAFFVIMANPLVDIAYAALDPRVRYG